MQLSGSLIPCYDYLNARPPFISEAEIYFHYRLWLKNLQRLLEIMSSINCLIIACSLAVVKVFQIAKILFCDNTCTGYAL